MTANVGRMRKFVSSPRLLLLAIASAACGCTTLSQPPQPFDAEQIQHGGGVAYLWTAGKAAQPGMRLLDYAVVIGIDNQALPPEYRPAAGLQPMVGWRMEIPAGRHVVKVLDKETTLAFIPFDLTGTLLVMEHETRLVEFTAEAGRAYVPLAADKCGRKWIWIAEAGEASPEGPSSRLLAFSEGLTAVGGEGPPEASC